MMEQYRQILNKEEARKYIKAGINLATELIAPTLGVKGNTIFIDKEYGTIEASDDGITGLESIEEKDPKLQLGVKILKEASKATNDQEGDGTTTTAIITNELVNQIVPELPTNQVVDLTKKDGGDVLKIRRGINNGLKKVIDYINGIKIAITSDEQITNIGRISSNNLEIGQMITEIFKKLGNDASVTYDDSNTSETFYEIAEGMSFDKGYISGGFVTDAEREEAVIEGESGTNVLVTDYKIQDAEHLKTLVELFKNSINDLLIIADDVSGIPLETLVWNTMRKAVRVVAVRAPGFGNQQEYLKDIAILTGAKFVSQSESVQFKDITPISDHLGKAQKVIVTKDKTTIIGGQGNKDEVASRITTLKNRLETTDSDYDKEKLQERIAKLSGGVAVIKVGGATETEVKEKKAKVLDAVSAVKSALKDGVVAGGGLTLLLASNVLDGADEGENILKLAIQKPFEQILINADLHYLEMKVQALTSGLTQYGYDVENDKWGNMIEMGIIDPAGVVKTALEKATSVAIKVLTCAGASVLIRKDKEESSPVDN